MIDSLLYHVTPIENLEAIQRDGLLPLIGPRSARLAEPRPAVYLFPTLAAVSDAAGSWLPDVFDEDDAIALLEVRVPSIVPLMAPVAYERCALELIPSSCIRVISRDLFGEHAI